MYRKTPPEIRKIIGDEIISADYFGIEKSINKFFSDQQSTFSTEFSSHLQSSRLLKLEIMNLDEAIEEVSQGIDQFVYPDRNENLASSFSHSNAPENTDSEANSPLENDERGERVNERKTDRREPRN